MAKPKTYQWRDPKGLTTAATIVLVVDLIWVLSGAFIEFYWGSRADYSNVTGAQLSLPQAVNALHDFLAVATLLGTIVLLLWILRVSKNASSLKGRPLQNSPWFAALWWYLIPFMSLVKPVESMSEIWDTSASDFRRSTPGRYILGVWWAALLGSGILGSVSRMLQNPPQLEILQWLAAFIQSAAFIIIVRRICRMQIEAKLVSVFSDEPAPRPSVLERITG